MADERSEIKGTLIRKKEDADKLTTRVGSVYLRRDKGEDAEPIAYTNADQTLLMVADGLGGAGNAVVNLPGGESTTEAYLAAHGLRQKLFDLLMKNEIRLESNKATGLAVWVQERVVKPLMKSLTELYPRKDMSLKGSIRKSFPTTLNMAVIVNEGSVRRVNVVWAGDSVCLVMTKDNTWTNYQADAGDAPMKDLVDARALPLKSQSIEVAADVPLIVACFTDGLLLMKNIDEIKETLWETAKSGEVDIVNKFRELLNRSPVGSGYDDTTIALTVIGKWSA